VLEENNNFHESSLIQMVVELLLKSVKESVRIGLANEYGYGTGLLEELMEPVPS